MATYQSGEYLVTPLPGGGEIRELASVQAAAPVKTQVTRLAFRNRFSSAEKAALYNAAKTNVDIQIYLDDLNAASFIDLQRPDTRAAVQGLETAGLIGSGRALQILDAPIQPDEVPS